MKPFDSMGAREKELRPESLLLQDKRYEYMSYNELREIWESGCRELVVKNCLLIELDYSLVQAMGRVEEAVMCGNQISRISPKINEL